MSADKSKKPMIYVIVAFFSVFIAAVLAVYVFPDFTKNFFGSVLKGTFMPKIESFNAKGLIRHDTKEGIDTRIFKHKHTFVYINSSQCNDVCKRNIMNQRQVHEAQGRERHRIQRIMIVTDKVAIDQLKKEVLIRFPKMDLYEIKPSEKERLLAQFRIRKDEDVSKQQRVYLISPHGDLWLYYPADKNYKKDNFKLPRMMIKDMKIILKRSLHG
jgi:hypothetical protein